MKKVCVFLKNNQFTKNTFNKIIFNNFKLQNFSQADTKPTHAPENQPTVKSNVDYEKEWTDIYLKTRKADMEIIEKELSEYEKKEVKALIDRVVALNKEETLYYVHLAERKSQLMSGFSLNEYDPLQPSNMMDNQNFWPKENPKWFATPSLQSSLGSFTGSSAGSNILNFVLIKIHLWLGVSTGTSESKEETKSDKKAEAKPEAKAEKSQYDIKLSSFDAGKKIALIKEVRGWLNLGLKEVTYYTYKINYKFLL